MGEILLQMTGINKSFFGVPVLKDAEFTLEKGSVHAIVGGNGAGKSTLMKILTGIYTKDSGTIKLEDSAVEINGYSAAGKLGIRMIFQELSDIPTMTVWENIFLNNEIKKGPLLDKAKMRRESQELLSKFKIDISPDTLMSDLGVGYCQMVEIAKALSMNARILVMDEPTASLSANEVNILFGLIETLKAQQVSIVYISHRMGEILQVADSITVLRDGGIVHTGRTENMTIDDIVGHVLGKKEKGQMQWHENRYDGEKQELLRVDGLAASDRVKDISFTLNKGEIIGIAGLLGSGRTEILETLFGIRKALEGSIYLNGEKIAPRSAQQAIEHGIALVPEDRRREGLVLIHSVLQNVILPVIGRISKKIFVDGKWAKKIADDCIKALNIKTPGRQTTAKRLSGGNQQKIVVAKWLETKPKILLLDEPTAGIDIGAKGEILDIVRDYANSGNAVIFVSSEISEMLAISDRILILNNGRLCGEFRHYEIESEEVIQRAIQL
ncbi:MAG: sugar ABC transporter ATP-binding protein [Clostridiales bacterium]|jgi:ribose transport system ATP-binding protein|nr:sugar ABC transporter ATP-binding protein [Clostridiales bacterium]